MIRTSTFDTIYVIESLFDNDKKTGTILYNDIIRWFPDKFKYVKAELVVIDNRNLFFSELEKVKVNSKKNNSHPYLHFEIHGSEEGFKLSSGETVSYSEVAKIMREINVITNNNLMVSLASCFGAYIFGEINPSMPSPFFSIIAPWEKINEPDLMKSFLNYFEFLLNCEDPQKINLIEAVKKLNESDEYDYRYYFYNSEAVFEKILNQYELDLFNPEIIEKRILDLMAKSLANINIRHSKTIPELRQHFERILIDERIENMNKLKDIFLMNE